MTTPTGGMSLAQDNLKILLADCATFRTLIGASGTENNQQTQARNRIHPDALPTIGKRDGPQGAYSLKELQQLRPYALTWTDDPNGYQRRSDAYSDNNDFNETGRLAFQIWRDVPLEIQNNLRETYQTFSNIIGQIIDEMCDKAGSSYLDIAAIGIADGPYLSDYKKIATEGYTQEVIIGVEWGS